MNNIWCELTASIRTRSPEECDFDDVASKIRIGEEVAINDFRSEDEAKEVLLCFRPLFKDSKLKGKGSKKSPTE